MESGGLLQPEGLGSGVDNRTMGRDEIRIVIGLVASVLGGVVALFLFALNGYQEDEGTAVLHTLWLAIPLALTAATIGVLTIGAVFNRERRVRWSIWAFKLVLAAVVVLGVVLAINANNPGATF